MQNSDSNTITQQLWCAAIKLRKSNTSKRSNLRMSNLSEIPIIPIIPIISIIPNIHNISQPRMSSYRISLLKMLYSVEVSYFCGISSSIGLTQFSESDFEKNFTHWADIPIIAAIMPSRPGTGIA